MFLRYSSSYSSTASCTATRDLMAGNLGKALDSLCLARLNLIVAYFIYGLSNRCS